MLLFMCVCVSLSIIYGRTAINSIGVWVVMILWLFQKDQQQQQCLIIIIH